jgi:hypothetical protein
LRERAAEVQEREAAAEEERVAARRELQDKKTSLSLLALSLLAIYWHKGTNAD